MRALLAVSPAGLPRIGEDGSAIGIDWRVLGFTLGVSLLTGLSFGLFPAFSASRSDLNSTLKESGNRSGTGFGEGKARSLLVVSEISLALVLLIGSALLIRTYIALHDVDPGFDSHNVLTMEMSLNGPRYQNTAGITRLLRDGRDRLNALPGVELAASGFWRPIDVEDGTGFQIVGRPVEKSCCGSAWMSITPGYLSLFRIPVLRGRDFTEHDNVQAPAVDLINETFARKFLPDEDPIGQHIKRGDRIETDHRRRRRLPRRRPGEACRPDDDRSHCPGLGRYNAAYANIQPLFWLVRTRGDPHLSISAITEQLRIASEGFPVAHIRTMDEVMGHSARGRVQHVAPHHLRRGGAGSGRRRHLQQMAYSVEQRTREMGIRMALGADRGAIRSLVVGQGMRVALVGVALGIAAAFGFTRLVASFLFGVKPWDPAAFLLPPPPLSAVALFAAWLPATRASKLDPLRALRTE